MPKRVYLSPRIDPQAYKGSRHHTAYSGSTVTTAPGIPAPLHKLEFVNGVARNVDENLYERFKDLGVCDTSKPRRPRRDENDEDDDED